MGKKILAYARFKSSNKLSDEEKAEIAAKKIIDPEYDETESIKYDYDLLVTDLDEISDFLRFDKEHTQITKKTNIIYILKISFQEFLELYQDMTGAIIFDTTPQVKEQI